MAGLKLMYRSKESAIAAPELNLIQHQLRLVKKDQDFLFGDYYLTHATGNTPGDLFKFFDPGITIKKNDFSNGEKHSNPNIIGQIHFLEGRDFADLFFIPTRVTEQYYAMLHHNHKLYLFLIEHPWNEKSVEITVVLVDWEDNTIISDGSAFISNMLFDWETGKLDEKINKLKNELIDLSLGE